MVVVLIGIPLHRGCSRYVPRKDTLKRQQEFTGYDMYDLIVGKFDVPYDVQINKTVFAGKPVLCFNVMWK